MRVAKLVARSFYDTDEITSLVRIRSTRSAIDSPVHLGLIRLPLVVQRDVVASERDDEIFYNDRHSKSCCFLLLYRILNINSLHW